MKLSFITATRNVIAADREQLLSRCVESVARVDDSEHLIIDGASTDGTIDLLQAFKQRFPNLSFVSEPDAGIYDALNKGIALARGEWIHVIGCDDYIFDCDILNDICKMKLMKNEEIIITPVERDCAGASINLKSCLYSIPYCHQGVLMRKSLIDRIGGFDSSLRLSGDYDLTLRAHLSGAVARVIPRKFAYYSLNGASSNWEKLRNEVAMVASREFNLDDKESKRFHENLCLPIRVLWPLLFHASKEVRIGAIWQMVRNLFFAVGVKK